MCLLKRAAFGKFNFNSTRLQNSSLAQENVPQNVGALLVGCLHHMGINIGGGAYLGVSQPLGNAHTVHAVEVEHGCHCVPECVGVDVGQAVALAELFEIVGHAVRVHGVPIVLGEEKAPVLVVFPQSQPFRCLPCAIPPEQLHGLGGQGNIAL